MSHSSSRTKDYVSTLCATAIRARRALGNADDAQRSAALLTAAARLRERSTEVVGANTRDVDAARSTGLSSAMIDRLALDSSRIAAIADGLDQVARLPDPLATPIAEWATARGLAIQQMRIPIGVIAVIYESRPNVTADVAAS